MPLPSITVPTSAEVITVINTHVDDSTKLFDYLVTDYKRQWNSYWNPLWSRAMMQEKIDTLENTPASDVSSEGKPISLLDAYYAKAWRTLQYILAEDPTRMFDAQADEKGRKLPDFPEYGYQRYFTSGWIYEIDGNNHMTVIEPIDITW